MDPALTFTKQTIDRSSLAKHLKAVSNLPSQTKKLHKALAAFHAKNIAATAPAGLTTRIDQAKMSGADNDAFKAAVSKMVADGTYKQLVVFHTRMQYMMHGSMGPIGLLRFLPWHRRFLLAFESALRSADQQLRPGAAAISIPYWRWQDPFPAWLQGFLPQKDLRTDSQEPARKCAPPPDKPTLQDIGIILNQWQTQQPGNAADDYTKFTFGLEGWGKRPDGSSLPAHNHVHDWVGGIMSDTKYSPTDPVFWIHHAEVDRLWHIWQLANPTAHPALTGKNRIMTPWTESYDELASIQQLGYTYDDLQP